MEVVQANVSLEEKDCVLARRETTCWKCLPTDVVTVYLGSYIFVVSLTQAKVLLNRLQQAVKEE